MRLELRVSQPTDLIADDHIEVVPKDIRQRRALSKAGLEKQIPMYCHVSHSFTPLRRPNHQCR